MGKLQVLVWIVCVMFFDNSSTYHLAHRYYKVWMDYKELQGEMLNMKTEINHEFIRLANRTVTKLNENETERLKDGYSVCFRYWMRILRESIGSLMIEQYPAPCSELLSQIIAEIDEEMTKEDTEVGVIIDRIYKCMENSQNCTSNDEVSNLRGEVLRFQNEWSGYKEFTFVPKWRRMISCFGNLSVAVENKLFKLSEHASRCGSGTHEQLMQELGLLPLSIHNLIGSSMDNWLEVEGSPLSFQTTGSASYERSEIMRTLILLQKAIMDYVDEKVTNQMNAVIKKAVNNIAEILIYISRPGTVSEEHQSCYHGGLQRIQNATRNYFENYLNHVCFSGLEDAKNEFINIVQCDLKAFEERLSKIRNCWADEEICKKIASRLQKFESSLHLWKGFSLRTAMQSATDCYYNATQLTYQSTSKFADRLKVCEPVPFPDIYHNLTRNVQPYPPYESSELCFLQPGDMDYW